jgi:hypothetical protein
VFLVFALALLPPPADGRSHATSGELPSRSHEDHAWKTVARGDVSLMHDLPEREQPEHLLALAARTRREMAAELGVTDLRPLAVYLCRDAASFQRAAGRLPTKGQAGIALPQRGRIVVLAFRGGTPLPVTETVVHEVAHVVLADAAGGNLPYWFHEGFALYQSHQLTLPEAFYLALAGVLGRLRPLSEIETQFPYGTRMSRLAYAQSLDAFSYLSSEIGPGGIGDVVRGVRRHGSFSLAFRTVYGTGVGTFEADWSGSLTTRYRWVLLTSGWIPLLLILTLGAGVLKWRSSRRKLKSWERESSDGGPDGLTSGGR